MRLMPVLMLFLLPAAAASAAVLRPGEDRRVMLTSFDRLRVDGPFRVEVASGPAGATLSGDARAIDRVAVRVEGGTLIVARSVQTFEQPVAGVEPVVLHVTVPALRGVMMNGGGDVRVARMAGQRIDITLNGSGSLAIAAIAAEQANIALTGTGAIALAGHGREVRVRSYGTGSIDAAQLSADRATLVAESSGTMTMTVRDSAAVTAAGTGGVAVLGPAPCRVRGQGTVTCEGLISR